MTDDPIIRVKFNGKVNIKVNAKTLINDAVQNFKAVFCEKQKCDLPEEINLDLFPTKSEYQNYLGEQNINPIKQAKHFTLTKSENGFDIYFYLDRSGDFAYSTLERAVARILIESNDVFKNALTEAFKTGMVDYVAGLDGNHNVQDNNEDCRDFNKIIEKNLSPYAILKSKNSEAQAEQVIKYLKQEFPEKIDALFKELAQNSKPVDENAQTRPKGIVNIFLSELDSDKDLNSKFSEWTNEQLKQFHQKLAEKFIPKMESMKTEYGTEVVIKHHQNSKVEGIKKSVIETLKNFKDAFCSDGEFNIPKKFSVFSFNNEADCKQYLCGNSKKFGKSFITNDKNGENSLYLYLDKEGNSIETLKQWIIQTVMENNGWDDLPQTVKEGMMNCVLSLSDNSHKNSDLNDIKSDGLIPHYIMNKYNSHSYLSGQVVRFLMESKPNDMHELLKDLNKLEIKDTEKVEKIVSNFMDKLKNYEKEFSNWVDEQLSQDAESKEEFAAANQDQEGESALANQTQEQSIEGKQDFIDQVINSSCITELGVKPECKDKLQDLIKALQECNEKSSPVPGELTQDESKEETTDEPKEEITDEPKESISDIFNNFRKTLCGNQECHGVKKVNVSTISGDKFKDLVDSSNYDKLGYFLASKSGDAVDIKLYVNHEKDPSVLDFGSQPFINSGCSYVPSDLNVDYEHGPYCAKAAQVMLFLTQRHSDHLAYFFEDLARSGCENGNKIIQEFDNYYNSEFQTWLTGQQLI